MVTQLCKICNKNPSKYKCPTCRTPFCSVPCNRLHKATPCVADPPLKPPTPPPHRKQLQLPDDAPILTPEQLRQLDTDQTIRSKTTNPYLLATLRRIDSAADPAAALRAEMQHPDFEQFCDEILSALGLSNHD